jgi:hypothetical protein
MSRSGQPVFRGGAPRCPGSVLLGRDLPPERCGEFVARSGRAGLHVYQISSSTTCLTPNRAVRSTALGMVNRRREDGAWVPIPNSSCHCTVALPCWLPEHFPPHGTHSAAYQLWTAAGHVDVSPMAHIPSSARCCNLRHVGVSAASSHCGHVQPCRHCFRGSGAWLHLGGEMLTWRASSWLHHRVDATCPCRATVSLLRRIPRAGQAVSGGYPSVATLPSPRTGHAGHAGREDPRE